MRTTLLIAGPVALLLTAAAAQAAPAATTPVPAEPAAGAPSAMNTMTIRQQLQEQLDKAGYTGVQIIPSSFLVRAKDKQGNPVEMVIGPDSFTTVTEIAPNAPAAGTPAPATPAPKG